VVSLPVVLESECWNPFVSILVVAGYVMSGAVLSLQILRTLLESVLCTLLRERCGCPAHVGYVWLLL
jgi:hypothetical protein